MTGYKVQLAITDKYTRQLKRAYIQRIKDTKASTDWDWVAECVPRGHIAVYNAIKWFTWYPTPILAKAYAAMFNTFDVTKDAGVINPEDFMLPNPAAESWLLNYAATEVTGITDNTKDMIRNVLTDGLKEQLTNQQTAERIREHLGLTRGQETAIENYRKTLIKQGIKDTQIEKLTAKYYDELLTYRAETIALTESHSATTEAWLDYTKDAERRGVLEGYQLRWLATPSERTCDHCMEMNGKTGSISSGEVDGETPPLHPRCRCVLVTERI